MSVALTQDIDVAQVVLYAFWIFFAGLVYYLHQENKREGYPLESNLPGRNEIVGYPPLPSPKTYRLADGTSVTVPRPRDAPAVIDAVRVGGFPGAPIEPIGDGMGAGIGPGAYAQRRDTPDVTVDGEPRIVPLRAAPGYAVAARDIDPRGLQVLGSDLVIAGVVRDVWVDRSEALFRYLEVEVPGAAGRGTVLLPVNFSRIDVRRVMVDSIMGRHFAGVPQTRDADLVTSLEEDKIVAYYGSGTLYAHPSRAEPLL